MPLSIPKHDDRNISNTRAKPKKGKCRICKTEFVKFNSLHVVCSAPCALDLAKAKQEKKDQAEKRKAKIYWRKKKESLKTKTQWKAEAQKWFNKFIRLRDRDQPCISCQRYHSGKYDAGHYRTTAAAPWLRYNEDNCHKQCVPCNQHLSGNTIPYRTNLISKIGIERVEALEVDHPPVKTDLDEIKAIIDLYKEKCKKLDNAPKNY